MVTTALAHQPFVVGDTAGSPDSAFVVEDPDISIVAYAEPSCAHPDVWLTFAAEPGQEVYFQLGIPVADTLADWRPRIALVAPGLPQADLGFDLPAGTGAEGFEPATEPSRFDEPFSNTSSWILVEERVVLPEGGPAWLVAWGPDGTVARLWVAVGETEAFDADDWDRILDLMDDVRAFHGADGSEVPAPDACDDAPAEVEAGSDAEAPAGCTTVPLAAPGPLLLFALAAARLRPRARRAEVESR